MISAYIVVRKEKHVDDRYVVTMDLDDALAIAKSMSDYWSNEYGNNELDAACYGDAIYSVLEDDAFSVQVFPIQIREKGERENFDDKR